MAPSSPHQQYNIHGDWTRLDLCWVEHRAAGDDRYAKWSSQVIGFRSALLRLDQQALSYQLATKIKFCRNEDQTVLIITVHDFTITLNGVAACGDNFKHIHLDCNSCRSPCRIFEKLSCALIILRSVIRAHEGLVSRVHAHVDTICANKSPSKGGKSGQTFFAFTQHFSDHMVSSFEGL